MKKTFVLVALISFSYTIHAQAPSQLNAAEMKLGIEKLGVVGSVLYVAAHPDDENTRLLSYLSKEKKVRTGYLSMTRGDGGQNLIGNEQSELLGLIRTQELLAARRIDGAEQFFTRANDFGFSKNPEEAMKIWGKDQILADAVWVIRKFRPDVIITRFPEDSRAGHGHHSASAILAREAFSAAADPKRYPEQLKYVQPWQAKRILANTFGGVENPLKLDIGIYNQLLGKGYGEIAAESRSNHKSQGFGSARSRGSQVENFGLVNGDAATTDLFDGIDLSWGRVKGGAKIGQMVAEADKSFDVTDPSKSVNSLVAILTEIEKLDDAYWKTQKEKEIKELIIACSGLWFEAFVTEAEFALGSTIPVRFQAIAQSDTKITLQQIGSGKMALTPQTILAKNKLQSTDGSILAEKISQPFWLNEKHPLGSYTFTGQEIVGNPENPDAIAATFTFLIAGKPISFTRPVLYKFADPVRGEIYQPVVIAPPVTTTLNDKAYIFTGNQEKKIIITLKAFADNTNGTLETKSPAGWKISPASIPFTFAKKDEEKQVELTVTPGQAAQTGPLEVSFKIGNQTFNRGIKTLSYNHIPSQTLFPLAETQLINIDLKTDGKNIGYIAGAGDLVPESLRQIGFQVTMLSENMIANTDLSIYDAIITGVRTYNINERIKVMQPKLLEYVNKGGTLLVQYNNNAGILIPDVGPYPFKVINSRVTDENAKVTVLSTENPALNYPNRITQEDFNGWIQERGLYFVSDADKRYTALFSINDPGEAPNSGSTIVANYGQGRYVYTALAFFRELPAGVPGAYRLFVNLIAKKQK